MIDERTTELVNSAIDGVLSDTDKAELDGILRDSAEAQEYYRDLVQLDSVLSGLPEQEFSAESHRQIIDSVPLTTSVTPFRKTGIDRISDFMSYGLAAAAGVVLAVGYYESREDITVQQDISQMFGTMAPNANPADAVATFRVDQAGLQSHVSLERRNGKLVLDITIDSDEMTDISVDFGNTALRFDALAQIQSQLESIQIAGHVIQVRSNGRQRFTVLLHRVDEHEPDDTEVVKLEYSRNGLLVQQGILSAV